MTFGQALRRRQRGSLRLAQRQVRLALEDRAPDGTAFEDTDDVVAPIYHDSSRYTVLLVVGLLASVFMICPLDPLT
jgi:hypothetical protein